MTRYAHPDTLVSTAWVADHAADPHVRLVEVNVDTTLYDRGHIPGAIGWSWKSQLADPVRRDILSRDAFERLIEKSGIDTDTTVGSGLVALSALGTLLLVVSAYLGGRMVYDYGISVARHSKGRWQRLAEAGGARVPSREG